MTKLIGLTGAYDFLERMILEPAGARYNPDWKKARENLENSHDENLDYLGTYFPRTVLESAVIFEHLMRTMPSVKKMLAERDVIRVLGCGTGGELLGFLIALGWEFNWELPAVEVDAIDGNEDALGMMQDIMHLCRDKWDFDLRVRTVTHKAEKSGFAPANVKLRDDYDVLVTSKCLGELNAVSQTPFLDFVCEFFDSIAPEGLIVMMDVTSRQPHNRGNDWTNLQMTGEFDTHRLVRVENIGPEAADRFLNSGSPGSYWRDVIEEGYTIREISKAEGDAPAAGKKGMDDLKRLFGDL